MNKTVRAAMMAAALIANGCKKDAPAASTPAPGASPATPGATPAAPAAAATEWLNLDKMGLKIQMPAGSKADDTSVDAPSASIAPPDYGYTVMVSTVTEAYTSEYAAAVEEVKKTTNGFKDFTRNEKTADGWIFEFEGQSVSGGALYGVVVRKTIAGKAYECSRNESSKDARDNVTKACLSLAAK